MISPLHLRRLVALAGLPTRPRPAVGASPADVVHRENKLRLLRYRADPEVAPSGLPVLLVPSLINRHYVLDLMPGKSLVRWLVAQGHEVYCIDWGTPGPEDAGLGMDDVVLGLLGRSVRVAGAGRPVHLLGYCMGGMFTAMLAAVRPAEVASLTALAAPIRMAGDPGLLRAWATTRGLDVDALVAAEGVVPWQLLQGAFQLLRPTLNLGKAVHLVDRASREGFLDGYLAMETWANDNVGLPGAFFATYINAIYRDDRLADGTLSLGGERVDLGAIRCPTHAIVFVDDHIAPAASCRALLELVSADERRLLELRGSHVGGVVSTAAARNLWPHLAAFWREFDGVH
ncbi:MAG: hypothetical protein RIT45_1196 [Pseudomonadota bacterium]